VNEVERRVEEGTHKGHYYVDCYSPKLGTQVQGLSCLSSLENLVELRYLFVYSVFLTELVDGRYLLGEPVLFLISIAFRTGLLAFDPSFSFWTLPYFELQPVVGIDKRH